MRSGHYIQQQISFVSYNAMIFVFFLKDDVIEYHIKNGKFPGDKIKLSKKPWMDVVVFIWVLLLVIPVCFAIVYLAYTGAWLTLGLIVLVLFVSKLVIHL